MTQPPLVSVITPVYNGAAYLGECIESVLAQTYTRWEHWIVDNRSSDESAAIAERHARRDPRIRLHRNETFLPLVANWNHALAQMPAEAAYCKVVHADDCLYPECLERMVALAEAHPSVGIVSAFMLSGTHVELGGLPYGRELVPGREAGGAYLRQKISPFGSPTALLLRSEAVRQRPEFYDAAYFHTDTAACLGVLRDWDLGFVQQVLTYSRIHAESQSTTVAARYRTFLADRMLMLREFGETYLEPDEYQRRLRREQTLYWRFLVRRAFTWGGREFLAFHQRHLRQHGIEMRGSEILRAAFLELGRSVLDPMSVARRVSNHWAELRRGQP